MNVQCMVSTGGTAVEQACIALAKTRELAHMIFVSALKKQNANERACAHYFHLGVEMEHAHERPVHGPDRSGRGGASQRPERLHILHYIILIILYRIMLHHIILYYISLCYIILHHTIVYYATMVYNIIL